jgi:hypothetical protein
MIGVPFCCRCDEAALQPTKLINHWRDTPTINRNAAAICMTRKSAMKVFRWRLAALCRSFLPSKNATFNSFCPEARSEHASCTAADGHFMAFFPVPRAACDDERHPSSERPRTFPHITNGI